MNLVQQANFLEDVPKDQLVSMSQDPNAQFPPFLVLSEIQRRATNEKNYQAMLNQPTTTVAEEVVNNFAQPTGLQGGAPQATPLPTNISAGLSGAPTAPMQMAASGGVTGYATGDMTALPAGSEPQSRFGSMMDSVFEIGSSVANWASENPVEAAATGLMFIPGIGWAGSAALRTAGVAYKGLKGIDYAKKAKQVGTAVKDAPIKAVTKPRVGQRVNTNQPMGEAAKSLGLTDDVIDMGRAYSPLRTSLTGTGILAGKTGYDYMTSPVSQTVKKDDTKDTKPMSIGSTFEEILAMNQPVDTDSKSKGLGQMDYRDMIRLGVGVMGAKDISELGDSVVGILDAQDKRGLVGLQGKLTEAQISKIEADIAAMPVKEIQSELSIYSKLLDQIKENSTGTEAEIKQIQSITDYISALGQELMTARGIDFAALDKKTKLLEASGIGKV
jgi:hypothetical protein